MRSRYILYLEEKAHMILTKLKSYQKKQKTLMDNNRKLSKEGYNYLSHNGYNCNLGGKIMLGWQRGRAPCTCEKWKALNTRGQG